MNAVRARLGDGRADRAAAGDESRPGQLRQVTFPDLAWAHFHWEERRRTGRTEHPDAANAYPASRAAFEARYGEIVGEYWSITKPSGVAVTLKRPFFLTRAFLATSYRFHRATDWVTREAPDIADALFCCETLAIQSTEVLTHASESVAVRRILAVASHLLGFIDGNDGKPEPADAREAARQQRQRLNHIRTYYCRAGARIGRIVYTWGMIIGLLVVAALAALVTVPLWLFGPLEWTDRSVQIFLVSYGAGAVGAFVSVLQRMAREEEKFVTHYDLGKRSLYVLGSYRPVLGAVFGVVTYFLLASDLLQTAGPARAREIFFYGSLAFVAGFSERFTSVLIRNVESGVPGDETGIDITGPADAPEEHMAGRQTLSTEIGGGKTITVAIDEAAPDPH